MLIFFDYVYYSSSKFYAKAEKEGSWTSGLAVITEMQCSNLFSLQMLIELILERKFATGKLSIKLHMSWC